MRASAAVADGVARGARDGDADFRAGAGGRCAGHVPGKGGVEQPEALDLSGSLGEPEQRQQRDDQVWRARLEPFTPFAAVGLTAGSAVPRTGPLN
jgi:hypothetical protein